MYRTYKLSSKNWKEFGSARKITVSTGLSFDQAREECDLFNKNRTSRQIAKGTFLEFEKE